VHSKHYKSQKYLCKLKKKLSGVGEIRVPGHNKWNQNNQFASFSARKTSTKSVAQARCRIRSTANNVDVVFCKKSILGEE
jgi:hypothetical protein